MSDEWTWKVADPSASAGLRLRYEPGGWGDILKGVWAAELVEWLGKDGTRLVIADPFAGAPEYPLVEGVRARVEAASGTAFHRLQAPLLARDALASTSGALLELGHTHRVYELDEGRRAGWDGRAELLDVSDGWQAVSERIVGTPDLLIVDPYDLAEPERWQPALPRLKRLAAQTWVLLYLFNKAPRSANALKDYRAMRAALHQSAPVRLLGRVPSDAVLPRAWHESILLGPGPLPAEVEHRLTGVTETLAWHILRAGVTGKDHGDS